jgi:hypothetical protein
MFTFVLTQYLETKIIKDNSLPMKQTQLGFRGGKTSKKGTDEQGNTVLLFRY